MSDNGEVEVEAPQSTGVLPKDVAAEIGSVKLFNKWSYEDVEIRDISLTYGANEHKTQERGSDKNTAITSKSDNQSTSHTPPADMPQSDFEKHNAQSSSD